MNPPTPPPTPDPQDEGIDPETGLPLPDPYPDYIPCPHCGEGEVEVWSHLAGGSCHNCGGWVEYPKNAGRGLAQEDEAREA